MSGKIICVDCNVECIPLWGVNLCEMCYNYVAHLSDKVRGDGGRPSRVRLLEFKREHGREGE